MLKIAIVQSTGDMVYKYGTIILCIRVHGLQNHVNNLENHANECIRSAH